MKRLAILGALTAALLAAPAPALAGRPSIYHSITVTMASAYFTETEGCLQTEGWISATDGRWASQGGGVDIGSDLALSVRVTDVCASTLPAPMAGGGGAVVFDGFGRVAVPLAAAPRLDWASSAGDIELVDQLDGGMSPARVAITWAGGPLSHDTTPNNHGKCADGACEPWMPAFDVVVNTHDNNLRREATATLELVVDGASIDLGPSDEAVVERIKSSCMEIPTGRFAGDIDYCY